MIRACVSATLLLTITATGWAEILQDNYLGNPNEPGWTLPYDGVAAQSSERDTIVSESWAGDDLVVPDGLEYTIQQFNWIGLLVDGPGATWDTVDVIILPRNPDGQGHPIAPGTAPIAEFNDLTPDQFEMRVDGGGTPEVLWGLNVYEGTVSIPEVTLPAGHYYFAVRVVGSDRGQHFMLTSGGGTDFGAGEMGVMQSPFFFEPDWIDIDDYLELPDPDQPGEYAPYATDFAYQVMGVITPEPASLVLLVLGGLMLRMRR